MSRFDCFTLTAVLMSPAKAGTLSLQHWDVLLRQARESGLLSRLALSIQESGCLQQLPERVALHLDSALVYAERQKQVVGWEVRCLYEALSNMHIPIVLLKGAAYVMANLPAAHGRVFSDIDILTKKSALDKVERALFAAGWVNTHHNTYDDRYYRQWMHELPPMQHIHRRSVLDIHHNILPETARANPDPELLLEKVVCIDARHGLYVLAAEDRIIHSATHLFFDGEFEHGLRDLLDMHDLLVAECEVTDFWDKLIDRAQQLTLDRPLYYALTQVRRLYHTPIPDEVMRRIHKLMPNGFVNWWMSKMFYHALMPPHSSCRTLPMRFALQFLYVRAHYLRMPLHLLIPHLTRKAFRSDDR